MSAQEIAGFENPVIAAVLVVRGREICLVFKESWDKFSLPMTKLQEDERPIDAAVRAASECFQGISEQHLEQAGRAHVPQQSLRYDSWKLYDFHIFRMGGAEASRPHPGVTCEWHWPTGFVNMELRQISPTARHIVIDLWDAALEAGQEFP